MYVALADGRPAAVNVGFRPTFEGATPGVVIEVHILDFTGDLYGQRLTVQLLDQLRAERRFASKEALIAQLEADVDAVRAACA